MNKGLVKGLMLLKKSMTDIDFNNMVKFLEDYTKRQELGACVKLIVCTSKTFYIEMSPSLEDISISMENLDAVRDLYRNCFVYLLDINNSDIYKRFNLLQCNRVLTVYADSEVDLSEYTV